MHKFAALATLVFIGCASSGVMSGESEAAGANVSPQQKLEQINKNIREIDRAMKEADAVATISILISDGRKALWGFNSTKALELHKLALVHATKYGNKETIANVYATLGVDYNWRGELDRAKEMLTLSVNIDKEIGNKEEAAKSLELIGDGLESSDKFELALPIYAEAARLYESAEKKDDVANIYNCIGDVHEKRGDTMSTGDAYTKALALLKEGANKAKIIAQYAKVATFHIEQGNTERAGEIYTKAKKLIDEIGAGNAAGGDANGDIGELATAYNELASAYSSTRQDIAEELYGKAMKFYEQLSGKDGKTGETGRTGIAVQYGHLAQLYAKQGNTTRQKEIQAAALKFLQDYQDKLPEKELASLYHSLGNGTRDVAPEYAAAAFRQAIKLYEDIGERKEIVDEQTALAIAYHKLGNLSEAIQLLEGAVAYYLPRAQEDGRAGLTISGLYDELGKTYLENGVMDKAEGAFNNALKHSETAGKNHPLGRKIAAMQHANIADVYKKRKMMPKACEYMKKSRAAFWALGRVREAKEQEAAMNKNQCVGR